MKSFVEIISEFEDFTHIKGADEKDISAAEKALNIKFAKDYREYLNKYGVASFDGHELTGITSSKRLNVVNVTLEQRELFRDFCKETKSCYVVEEANIDGIVIWQAESGEIYECAPNIKAKKIYNSLSEYVSKLSLTNLPNN